MVTGAKLLSMILMTSSQLLGKVLSGMKAIVLKVELVCNINQSLGSNTAFSQTHRLPDTWLLITTLSEMCLFFQTAPNTVMY